MYRKYYLVNVYKKDNNRLVYNGSMRFEKDEKRKAIEYIKFVKSQNYAAYLAPKIEEN